MFSVCLIVRPGCYTVGHWILQDFPPKELLYALEEVDVLLRHKCYRYAVTLCTGSTTDAMNVVFHVMGHVIVDDHQNVINVDATCHDFCCHEHVYLASLEAVHHLVTLCLRKV